MTDIQMSLKYGGEPCKHAIMQTRHPTRSWISAGPEYSQLRVSRSWVHLNFPPDFNSSNNGSLLEHLEQHSALICFSPARFSEAFTRQTQT